MLVRTRRFLSALSCRDARWLGLVVALAACSSGASPSASGDAATGTDRAVASDTAHSDLPASDAPASDAPTMDAAPLDAPALDATGDVAATDVDDPLESLRVDPAMTTLRVTAPSAPQTVQLRAQGITRMGRTIDVTPLWTVDRPAALTVNPLDVSAIAEGLRRVHEDTALRADLRARGLAHAATFTWERCARQTLAAYRQALAD